MAGSRFLTAGAQVPAWTSVTRPSTPNDGTTGFNRTSGYCEQYSAATGRWSPVEADPGLSLVTNYNADPSGADDVTEKLVAAIQNGGRLWVPDGDYLIAAAGASAGGAYATITNSIHVTCSPGARFFTNGVDHDFIRISAPVGGVGLSQKISVVWEGGIFDQSGQKNSTSMPFTNIYPPGGSAGVGTSATCDGLSIRGSYIDSNGVTQSAFSVVRVLGTRFTSGAHWLTAGGDSHIYAGDGADMVEIDCLHEGSRDVAVYVSRDGTGAVGNNASIRGSYLNCFYGIAFKRGFREAQACGYFENCVSGVLVNHVVGGQTTSVRITGTFVGCHQSIREDYASAVDVSGATVLDMGALLPDGAALDPFLGNPAGVLLHGCTQCRVGSSRFNGFNAAYSKIATQGILLDSWTDDIVGTVSSTYNDIADNIVTGLHSIGSETAAGADLNRWTNNRGLSCDLTGAVLTGAASSEIRYREDDSTDYFTRGILVGDGASSQAAVGRFGDPTTGLVFGTNQASLQIAGTPTVVASATAVALERQAQGPVGSAAAPGFAFIADTTTGMFRSGTGRLGLAAGAVAVVDASATAFKPLAPLTVTAAAGLVSTGTTQATALALTADINEIDTAGSGVALPTAVAGLRKTVINADASLALSVYPHGTDTIGTSGAGVAVSVPASTLMVFECASAGKWWAGT